MEFSLYELELIQDGLLQRLRVLCEKRDSLKSDTGWYDWHEKRARDCHNLMLRTQDEWHGLYRRGEVA